MKKVLLVSGQEYSKTNRGIDTMTDFFLEYNYNVEHLVFPINPLRKNKIKSKLIRNLKQSYSKESYLSYIGIFGKICSDSILDFMKKKMYKTLNEIEFQKYDIIVLEAGVPFFLLDLIPADKILIIRQSDPLEISVGTTREYFKNLEKKALEKSNLYLFAHEEEFFLENKENSKIQRWKSGFEFKEIGKCKTKSIKKSLTYMGVHKIDYILLKEIAIKNKNIQINIIGNYKEKIKLDNVKFHGYLSYKEYIKVIQETDCFIVPYEEKSIKKFNYLGMTSKFYIPMSLGIPILTINYGRLDKSLEKYNVFTYNSIEDFQNKINIILNKKFKITKETIEFLENLKIENRKKELQNLLYKIVEK